MNVKKYALATLAVGVACNIYDFVVHEFILSNGIYSRMSTFFNQYASIAVLVIGVFVAAAVFVWVYDRVQNSFDAGIKGGVTFGLFAGVLINFPTWIMSHILITGFTYELAWTWAIAGMGWSLLAGAVAGLVYQRSS